MSTVNVGNLALELTAPGKVSERWAPMNAMRPGCEVLAFAAALGLCSRNIRSQVHYQHDTLAFGAAVIDFLTSDERKERVRQADGSVRQARPAFMAEIIAAGGRALLLCRSTAVDVEGAADFGGPPDANPSAGGQSSKGDSTADNS